MFVFLNEHYSVCVCMCVRAYVYVYVCMYACVYTALQFVILANRS